MIGGDDDDEDLMIDEEMLQTLMDPGSAEDAMAKLIEIN